TITATVASGSATLAGATATTNGAGLATFSGLTLSGLAGTVTLSFGATGLTSVQSGPISLGPGAPAALALSQQPSGSAQSGVAFAQQPRVILRDGAGNRVS